ncbi:MAG: membrane protein insertase YidC [Gemmatimonadota bacterium]
MDRRVIWALVLMMVIAIVPSFLLKSPVKNPSVATADSLSTSTTVPSTGADSQPTAHAAPPVATVRGDSASGLRAEDTVHVQSPLYDYAFSTRGGRLIQVTLPTYRSMALVAPPSTGAAARPVLRASAEPLQMIPAGASVNDFVMLVGRDSIRLDDWDLTPSTKRLSVSGPSSLTLTGSRNGSTVELTYTFKPDDYQIGVKGQIRGIGPNGGTLLVGMGHGLQQTEADSLANHNEYGVVTKANDTDLTRFSKLTPGEQKTFTGPFEWVAVKSKYFVTALLALDSSATRISGVTATPLPTQEKHPLAADVRLSLPLNPSGNFGYSLYAGPMEYHRLSLIGHGFDDVNPYGWPGLRTIIRPVALVVRSLLVWMHTHLSLPYGLVLICFGIMVRLILWPLNQKAMRASMAMQALQPQLKVIQDRFKDEPQKLQQEMFKLYKEHNVNPFGGCWPMLIPMPVLFALFFVFQNTIELRGAHFLWLPDLAQKDPFFILPVVMGLSMYGLSKVGQIGMESNPQMKMMLYLMPAMMTFLFFSFASGLNLYYTVSNLASIPQQWLLAKERLRRQAANAVPVVEVKTKKQRT